tara:strand:- start:309 stop:491 length:183 start_codon:yes stop_codon:yes gene_type:complete
LFFRFSAAFPGKRCEDVMDQTPIKEEERLPYEEPEWIRILKNLRNKIRKETNIENGKDEE